MSDTRRERLARNEATFRTLNEEMERAMHAKLAGSEPHLAGYVCECGNVDCAEIVRMTVSQYETVRRDSQMFLITPGHEMPEIEDVAYREAGFAVVRKHDDVAEIVQEADPRT